MLAEIPVAGIYLSPIVGCALLEVPIFLLCRRILLRLGVLQWVWHPALFEFSLAIIMLSVLVFLFA